MGTELLGTERLDTNSLLITKMLQRYGVEVDRKAIVRDDADGIAQEVRRMVGDLDLILVTGGLGPTTDDQTRRATAKALRRQLVLDDELLNALQVKFQRWGLAMPESNACQADVIDGARVLHNPRGTAPGMEITHEGSTVFLFPGVPSELRGLVESALEPWLAAHTEGQQMETWIVRLACLSESALEDLLAPAYERFDSRNISVLSSPGDIQVHLTATGAENDRRSLLEAMTQEVKDLVGESYYAMGVDSTLEGTVAELLLSRGLTLATAESCTAGLLSERLTRIAGSSNYFVGGVVVYSNPLKESLLRVSPKTLAEYGAVSREVVDEMARGAIRALGSDLGIGISGVAGPGGGTAEKPVGTVHIAVARSSAGTTHRELHLPGGRDRVRWLASQWALDILRRELQWSGS